MMLYSALFMEIVNEQERQIAERVSPHRREAVAAWRRRSGRGLRSAIARALVRAGTFVDGSVTAKPASLAQ
jgi:hypothetical protein